MKNVGFLGVETKTQMPATEFSISRTWERAVDQSRHSERILAVQVGLGVKARG